MDAYQRTHNLLTQHRDDVVKLAKQLMDHEVLTHNDVERLIGPRKYPNKVCTASYTPNIRVPISPRSWAIPDSAKSSREERQANLPSKPLHPSNPTGTSLQHKILGARNCTRYYIFLQWNIG